MNWLRPIFRFSFVERTVSSWEKSAAWWSVGVNIIELLYYIIPGSTYIVLLIFFFMTGGVYFFSFIFNFFPGKGSSRFCGWSEGVTARPLSLRLLRFSLPCVRYYTMQRDWRANKILFYYSWFGPRALVIFTFYHESFFFPFWSNRRTSVSLVTIFKIFTMLHPPQATAGKSSGHLPWIASIRSSSRANLRHPRGNVRGSRLCTRQRGGFYRCIDWLTGWIWLGC